MSNIVNNNYNNAYNISNSGLNQQQIDNTINKSKDAVNTTVDNNALLSASMGIDKESVFLAAPLTAAILFINNVLMAGEQEKSLLGKFAKMGDKISATFNLSQKGNKLKPQVDKFKNGRFAKYFGDNYKAIHKSSMGKVVKMREKYAEALVDSLSSKVKDLKVTKDSPVDEIIKAADDFLKTNPKNKNIQGLKNMLNAANSNVGKTNLGKTFAKGGLKFKEIAFSTSDFLSFSKKSFSTLAMDTFSIIYFASVLKNAIKETKEAPKGEKLSTFTHILFEDWAPLMVFQPATKLAYNLGGNKYRGMSVDARKKLADIVKTANADKNITSEALKMANLQKKLLLKGGTVSQVDDLAKKGIEEATKYVKGFKKNLDLKWWEKPLKSIGKFLSSSLDDIKAATTAGKVGKKIKGFGSGAMRFVFILFVLQPLLQKPITKLGHMIFGKPETYIKKQEEALKQEQDSTPESGNLIDKHLNKPNENNQQVPNEQVPNQQAPNQQVPNQIDVNNQQGNTPSAALNLSDKGNKDYNGYIPSIKVDTVDTSEQEIEAAVNEILKDTDSIVTDLRTKYSY